MNEQELDLQIKEGEAAVATAEKSIAEGKSFSDKIGIDDNFLEKVLACEHFSEEFKDKIREEVANLTAELDAHQRQYVEGKSSNIAARQGVTKI